MVRGTLQTMLKFTKKRKMLSWEATAKLEGISADEILELNHYNLLK